MHSIPGIFPILMRIPIVNEIFKIFLKYLQHSGNILNTHAILSEHQRKTACYIGTIIANSLPSVWRPYKST